MTVALGINEFGKLTYITEGDKHLNLTEYPDIALFKGSSNSTVIIGSRLSGSTLEIGTAPALISRIEGFAKYPRETLNAAWMEINRHGMIEARQALATLTAEGAIADSPKSDETMLCMRLSALTHCSEASITVTLLQCLKNEHPTKHYVEEFAKRFYNVCNFSPVTDYTTFPLKNVFQWDDADIAAWIANYEL